MSPHDPEWREQLAVQLVALRPELHRFCARMVGSIFDGEDLVHDTILRAVEALPRLEAPPDSLRAWALRIAQRLSIDHLRRHEKKRRDPRPLSEELAEEREPADDALARAQSVSAAVSRFTALPPVQRSCVILKDVLGCSLEEIAAHLSLSVPAVKAALHRGRARLRQAPHESPPAPPSAALARYASLFNARAWDTLRAMLAEDVKLELISRLQRSGRQEVGEYFTNYARFQGWRLEIAWLEGRCVLAAFRQPDDPSPDYFIEVVMRGEEILQLRDYYYVPYIARDAQYQMLPAA